MGIFDKAKDAITGNREIVDKAKEYAAQNSEDLKGHVDRAGDFIDQRTGGKYADKVDKLQDAAGSALDKNASQNQPPATPPTTPPAGPTGA